jgi:hypothetical protein
MRSQNAENPRRLRLSLRFNCGEHFPQYGPLRAQRRARNSGENVMKKMLCVAVLATAFISAPALAGGGGKGVGVGANVLTGKGGVLGLLDGRGALVVNAAVTTGKGGVLGAVLGKSGVLGGLLGGGCGCGH